MYLPFFFLLLSSGVFSSFLPLKKTSHLQNQTNYRIIDEMLCLLEAENHSVNGNFCNPILIKNQSYARCNTEVFIQGLEKLSSLKCMKTVEVDMQELKRNCSILRKSSCDKKCPVMMKTNFSEFKESLEEFLKWVNAEEDCKNITRSGSSLYLDGNCKCPD